MTWAMGDGATRLVLHDGVGQPWLDAGAVAAHLGEHLPWLTADVRGDLLACAPAAAAALAPRLCDIRVTHPTRRVAARRPLKPELDYERRVLAGATRAAPGVIYDGCELQQIAWERLPEGERRPEAVHVWLSERLFATWDEADRRYHLRVIVCGLVSIVSTAGMVRAPARERAHYLARRLGLRHQPPADPTAFLGHEDPRTTEVAKGYAMQAVVYALTGEPFCEEPACRLFNAHWQREMLTAQLEGDDYCPCHRKLFEAWAAGRDRHESRAD